jgi:anti-sigma B factor antagonist
MHHGTVVVTLGHVQRATDGEFSVRVRQVAGATVVTVVGEVDLDTAPELEFKLTRADEPVVLDLSGVTFFASAGVACLLSGQRRPHIVPSPAVKKVLTLADLDDVLPHSESLADALGRVAQ